MEISPASINSKSLYKLMSGIVVPRPIAWVSTISENKVPNLAPFSFFTVASPDPPILCFSVGAGLFDGELKKKDTLRNIEQTKEFVIHILSTSMATNIDITSKPYPEEINEFDEANVEMESCKVVNVPKVKNAPIQMECTLENIIKVGSNNMIFGKVVNFNIKDDFYLHEHKINHLKLDPIARIANKYASISEYFNVNTKVEKNVISPDANGRRIIETN